MSSGQSDTPVRRPPRWRAAFLAALAETGNVTTSAGLASTSRGAVYHYRDRDAVFATAMNDALEEAADRLESEARRRAVDGVEETVYYRGEACGAIRRYSDGLLMFLLKGTRPSKFREHHALEHSGSMAGEVVVKKLAPGISMDDL